MKLLRLMTVAAGVALALAATADRADAGGIGVPCANCGHGFGGGFGGGGGSGRTTLFGGGAGPFAHQKLPAFQAAPWYQYWPYDGHFMTPAPISGAFYGPPMTGNFPVNPYFPGGGGFGYGFGGSMPGGPPTGFAPPVAQPMPMPPR